MKELIATIHFIGLALFSSQVPNVPGLHVLVPRVESHVHEEIQLTDDVDFLQAKTVEPHQAFIIYDQNDFLTEIGWTSESLPAHLTRTNVSEPPRYRFVRLSGELVKFHTDGRNATVQNVSLPLPRPKCGAGIAEADVAATISIPVGQLGTCAAHFTSTRERRFDTQLKLKNYGELIITAQAGSVLKALTLRGGATAYVANIPEEMLSDPAWQASGAKHFIAYYDLITTKCPEQGLTPPTTTVKSCPVSALALTAEVLKPPTNLAQAITDSGCSNSAWP